MNETTITVAGRLVADPVIRQTQAGVAMTTFRIATNARRPRAGSAEYEDGPTSFYNVRAFRALGANAALSLHRGEPVIVTGVVEVTSYDRQDGSKGSSVDISARHIGHDMSWGISVFRKVTRTAGDGGPLTEFRSAAGAFADAVADPETTAYASVDGEGEVHQHERIDREGAESAA